MLNTYARIMASVASAVVMAATIPTADAQSHCAGLDATTCAAATACKWLPPHKAGDINPKTKKPYKKDSNGQCRLDGNAASVLLMQHNKTGGTVAPKN